MRKRTRARSSQDQACRDESSPRVRSRHGPLADPPTLRLYVPVSCERLSWPRAVSLRTALASALARTGLQGSRANCPFPGLLVLIPREGPGVLSSFQRSERSRAPALNQTRSLLVHHRSSPGDSAPQIRLPVWDKPLKSGALPVLGGLSLPCILVPNVCEVLGELGEHSEPQFQGTGCQDHLSRPFVPLRTAEAPSVPSSRPGPQGWGPPEPLPPPPGPRLSVTQTRG